MSASLIFDTEALTSVTFDENPLLRNSLIKINKVVSPAGIEPATYALGGRRAIQLCHGDFSYQSASSFVRCCPNGKLYGISNKICLKWGFYREGKVSAMFPAIPRKILYIPKSETDKTGRRYWNSFQSAGPESPDGSGTKRLR